MANCVTAHYFAAMAREYEQQGNWSRAFDYWQAAMDNHEGRHTERGMKEIREWDQRQQDVKMRIALNRPVQ